MIAASLVQPWAWSAAALVALLFATRVLAACLLRRRRVEFERRLLELLHLATHRAQPFEPVLHRAAAESSGRERRWLEQIGAELMRGSSLHEALKTSAGGCFAPHVLAAIDAAEGTAQLPLVLGDLARREERAAALRYRVLLAASYPMLLSLLLLGLGTFWTMASWSLPGAPARLELAPWILATALLSGGLWLLLAFGWSHGPWTRLLGALGNHLPWLGARLRLLPAARALRSCAALTAGGADLHTALRQAAPVAADRQCAVNLCAAAELAETGAPAERIWQRSGMPAFVVARLLMGRTSREQLAGRLTDLAEQCQRRCAYAIERALGALQPVVVLGFGVIIALQFFDLMSWVEWCRSQAMEQMPW